MKAMLDGEGIEYSTIDLTEEPEAQDTYGVTGIPALVINGEIKFTGVTPIEEITAALTTKKEDE